MTDLRRGRVGIYQRAEMEASLSLPSMSSYRAGSTPYIAVSHTHPDFTRELLLTNSQSLSRNDLSHSNG